MKKLLMFLCAVTLVFGMVATAKAVPVVIFHDDFNRIVPQPNPDLNTGGPGGWSWGSSPGSGSAIVQNALSFGSLPNTGNNTAFAANGVDLSLFTNVILDLSWRASPSTDSQAEAGTDRLILQESVDGGTTYSVIWGPQPLGGTPYQSEFISLSSTPSDYRFRFLAIFGEDQTESELVQLDFVRISGEPVPEPATIALLGIGLAGLAGGAARRKWKKKAVDNS